jgi:hypothetical protein
MPVPGQQPDVPKWRYLLLSNPVCHRLGERPPTGPGWVHEIKHDGYRLMARRDALSVGIRPAYTCRVPESSKAPAPCYIGFCPGSAPTSLSWSQSGFCFWRGRQCMP